jgi:hypothetical protein
MNAEVSIVEPRQMAAASEVTPLTVLMRAIQDNSCDLARLEKLMDLEARWRADRAKQAYVRAFSQFKKNMPDVVKDMLNKQYGSDYSSLANLVNTTNKVLGEYGLNARWQPNQTDGMSVDCIMTHEDGHEERVTIKGPLDTSGAKNPLQQIKSTLTYLEGASFQAITGVVARSASVDDDGNGSSDETGYITPEQVEEILRRLKAIHADTPKSLANFLAWIKADAIEHIAAANYKVALDRIDQKGKELNAGSAK